MQVLTNLRHSGFDDTSGALLAVRRGNRRRLVVFGGVFTACLLAGQAWNFARPDAYLAHSRLKVVLPDVGDVEAGRPNAGGAGALLSNRQGDLLQMLTSRGLLRLVAIKMAATGQPLPADGEDPGTLLQAMLRIQPTPGTDVLRLEAVGEVPAQLAALLNSWAEVARAQIVVSQARAADSQLDAARAQLAQLEHTAAERRADLERFRGVAGVQAERDEDEAVARSKGLTVALNNAVEKEAAADARLHSLSSRSANAGPTIGARDDPTLASMEARASQAREELRDLERTYTPEFMAMDPHARALRARLGELERQIAQQRSAGEQTAMQLAQQDLDAAHATVERLRVQLAQVRPDLVGASARFAQAKTKEDDLAQVEKARREMIERVARLEADNRRGVPTVEVLEAAAVPTFPIAPDRVRDGFWVFGGALALAVLAMALVEVFNRMPVVSSPGGATTVVLPVRWGSDGTALPVAPMAAGLQMESSDPKPAALAAPAPRVLQQAEAAALLAAAQGMTRTAAALALMGLRTPEVLALRAVDVDFQTQRLTVAGPWSRVLQLPSWLAQSLAAQAGGGATLLQDVSGQPLADADLQTMLACAAIDAGIPRGATLSAEHLRNTCIDWLLGQGLRFSDLPALVGRVEGTLVEAFAGHAAQNPRRPRGEIGLLMPALQLAPPP